MHLLDLDKETCLIPGDSEEENEQKLVALNYNFVTESFFMNHRSYDLSFRVSVDKLVRLNQDLVRLERAYNDAMGQAGGLSDVVDTMKERLNAELAKYFGNLSIFLCSFCFEFC